MTVKGFMEDWDGEMVIGDIRNFKDEQDFLEKAKAYVYETRGYKVPVLPPTQMEVTYSEKIGEWWIGEREGAEGQIITVYKSDLEWENVDI